MSGYQCSRCGRVMPARDIEDITSTEFGPRGYEVQGYRCKDKVECCRCSKQRQDLALQEKIGLLRARVGNARESISRYEEEIARLQDEMNEVKHCDGMEYIDMPGCHGCSVRAKANPTKIMFKRSVVQLRQVPDGNWQGLWQAEVCCWEPETQRHEEPFWASNRSAWQTPLQAVYMATQGRRSWELSPEAEEIIGKKMYED